MTEDWEVRLINKKYQNNHEIVDNYCHDCQTLTIPDEGEEGFITDLKSNKVVGLRKKTDNGNGILEEKKESKKAGQIWLRNEKMQDGWFTFENKASGKCLIAGEYNSTHGKRFFAEDTSVTSTVEFIEENSDIISTPNPPPTTSKFSVIKSSEGKI